MREKMMMRVEKLNELLREEEKDFTVEYVQRWKIGRICHFEIGQ